LTQPSFAEQKLLNTLSKMRMGGNFTFCQGRLFCEHVDLSELPDLVPESEHGTTTPLYVYSKAQLEENIGAYKDAFAGRDHVIGFR
jgi:hypothetical protein